MARLAKDLEVIRDYGEGNLFRSADEEQLIREGIRHVVEFDTEAGMRCFSIAAGLCYEDHQAAADFLIQHAAFAHIDHSVRDQVRGALSRWLEDIRAIHAEQMWEVSA